MSLRIYTNIMMFLINEQLKVLTDFTEYPSFSDIIVLTLLNSTNFIKNNVTLESFGGYKVMPRTT